MTDDSWFDVDPFDELEYPDPDTEDLEPDGVHDESTLTLASHPVPSADEMEEGQWLGLVIDPEDDDDSGVPE